MFSTPIALLLFAAFVLQGYNARPYQNEDSAVHALEERLDLAHIFFSYERKHQLDLLAELKFLLEEWLKDPKARGIQSDEMESNLDEIRNLIADNEQLENDKDLNKNKTSGFLEKFSGFLGKFAMREVLDPDNDIKYKNEIKEKSYDEERLEVNQLIEDRLKEVVEKLLAEIQRYIDGLTKKQRNDEEEFLHWTELFKADRTNSGRLHKIRELIENFQLSDFLW